MPQSWYSNLTHEEDAAIGVITRLEQIAHLTANRGQSGSLRCWSRRCPPEGTKISICSEATMKKPYAMLVVVVAAFAVSSTPGISQQVSHAPAREGPTLILAAKVPLTGVSGRIDHFTLDPKRRLPIFSGWGKNTIEIVNNFQGRHVKTITGLDEPQGPLYVPGLDKLFVANAGNGVVNVYDTKTWNLRKSISLGDESDTDNLRYDEDAKQVFV